MLARLITGVFLALSVSLSIIFFPPLIIKIIVVLLTAIGAYECARMLLPKSEKRLLYLSVFFSMVLSVSLMFLNPSSHLYPLQVAALPILFLLLLLFHIFFPGEIHQVTHKITGSLFTVIYCGILFSFLGLLRDTHQGKAWLFYTLACTFSSDTGAFFAGRYLGKHKLAPKISPNKTIEGFFGGVLMSIGVAFFMSVFIFKNFSSLEVLVIGSICGMVGPFGDLTESLIKRGAGVKDSGKLIPGHGGLLDRVDALLFTAPVVYGYAYWVNL